MLRRGCVLMLVLHACRAPAAELVSVPWTEFRRLFEADLRSRLESIEPVPANRIQVHETALELSVDTAAAEGRLSLRGQLVSGSPAAVPLFDSGLLLVEVDELQGATLLGDEDGLALLPEVPVNAARGAADGRFVLRARVRAALRPDGSRRLLDLALPVSTRSRVQLQLAPGLRLVDASGVAGADGVRHLRPGERLRVAVQDVASVPPPAVDLFTLLEPQADALWATTHVLAREPMAAPLQLRVAGQAVQVAAGDVALESIEPGLFRVRAGNLSVRGFAIRHRLLQRPGSVRVVLPEVLDNRGSQGNVAVRPAPGLQVELHGQGLLDGLAVSALSGAAREVLDVQRFARLPVGRALDVTLRALAPLPAPEVVLDHIEAVATVTRAGTALTTLRFTLPGGGPRRLRVEPPPGARPWLLTLDGRPARLLASDDGAWLVERDAAASQRLELAYLTELGALGLEGRLDLALPRLPLAAQRLDLVVGLSDSLALLGVDGELQPVQPPAGWQAPPGFDGSAYHLRRPFYSGQPLQVALHYREHSAEGEGS